MDLSTFAAAKECGNRTAVIWEAGSFSYAQLAERVGIACAALGQRGYGPATLLAIRASNRWPTLVLILACIERGIPFVAIHPRWTQREVQVVMQDARPVALCGDAEVDSLTAGEHADGTSPFTSSAVDISDAAPLAILYSSGTTGTPKGAILSRAAFVASAQGSADNLGWQADDRWLLCLPLCHIGGLSIVTRCLLGRRAMVLLPKYEASHVLHMIVRHRVTLLSVVPTMLKGLLDAAEAAEAAEAEGSDALARLRAVLCGGAATPMSLVERAVAAGVNVLCTYGLTEACSQVTVQKWLPKPLARRGCGTPLSGLSLSIQSEQGVPLPPGEVGRIVVRGSSLLTGYVGQEPLLQRWFDTGDLGELDEEGTLYVHARRVDLIVTGGENVYPLEVEQELLRLPSVRAAVVFGIPDPQYGAAVAAALIVSPDFQRGELAELLSSSLASFKRPRWWARVDSFPELPSGKLDRRRVITELTPLLAKEL